MKLELLRDDIQKIQDFLETVVIDGGKKNYDIEGIITPVRFHNGMSGFEYRENDFSGKLSVGLILGGTGYILRRILFLNGEVFERNDYFNNLGEVTFTSEKEALKAIVVDYYEMDMTCPILNHFYNFLSYEYRNALEGKSQTALVFSVETLLRNLYESKSLKLDIENGPNDPAITNLYNKILAIEMDPVLSWEERQLVFSNHKKELSKVLNTKIRAHQLSKALFKTRMISKNLENFLARCIARPLSNSKGILNKYTIGKIIWFLQTVRNNLGYSVALAVYGPFTYYFITMPMNPHAMQAVGYVRSSYLEAKERLVEFIDKGEVAINEMRSKEAAAAPKTTGPVTNQTQDSISTRAAAPLMSNIINASSVSDDLARPLLIQLGDGATQKVTPSILNMLLTTDSDEVNKASWIERMSRFKQMQIAYEQNIEYASRMGRLEQLETQYNFPMQVEATWEELERYNNQIFKLRLENPNISAKMKQYLFNEVNRTHQLQLYLWDRMGRFMLDQIYVMLDQDKEQKRNDYYVGRSFVFMEEMTNILSWRYKNLKRPEGFERIVKLAEFYKKNRQETGSVLKNLKANSDLFKQKDLLSTTEFRSYMKRQWEILFLQNSKAEEAANMGLNMYIWSVRNTVWVLQSIYSAKRDELLLLLKRDVSGQILTPAEMLSRSKVSMLYETLYHNLSLEYVGIREEIMNRLGKDIESNQRMIVIENLKEFLSDREKLDNLGVANSKQQTAGTNI